MRHNLIIKIKPGKFVFASGKRRLQTMRKSLVAFLFLSMLSVLFIVPGNAKAQSLEGQNQSRTIQRGTTFDPNRNSSFNALTSYAGIVEKATPAVVAVRSERRTTAAQTLESPFSDDPLFREFFGRGLPQMRQTPRIQRGLGSGVIVQSNGTILTNNHVVNGATRVKVELPDKRTFEAKVIGTDPATDLAVLKIEATNLPAIPLGDSDRVRVGDVVLAIGNPLGLRQTVTSGIISAKGRQTGVSDGSFEDFLQTDAAINHGNSGGALVNLNGELVGINSQILSPTGASVGLGFAIPANMAKSVMAQLLKDGKVRRGMIGVGIQDVTSDLANDFGLKEIRGVIVNSVTPNSPAERAGIKQGDVIVGFNGVNVSDGNELRNRVAQTAPNTPATIEILRNGSKQSLRITLGEFQPKTTVTADENSDPDAQPVQGKLGLSLQPVTPQITQQLNLKDAPDGLVVTNVQPGSPADDSGIERGDIILQVNRQSVRTVDEVQTAIGKSKGNSVLLLISRNGQSFFVSVRI
jgi:serine protease Do